MLWNTICTQSRSYRAQTSHVNINSEEGKATLTNIIIIKDFKKTLQQRCSQILLPAHGKSFFLVYAQNRNYSRIFYIGFTRFNPSTCSSK